MAGNDAVGDLPGDTDKIDGSNSDRDAFSLEPQYYDMSKERKMIIFNHFEYNFPYPELRKAVSPRHGTDCDVEALTKTWRTLGFDVQAYHDRTHDQILSIMDGLCSEEHSGTSCVCVCIMTHGCRGGRLCARDKAFRLGDIVSKLQDHAPGLVGKPKLVIVQACCGPLLDAGQPVHLDGSAALVLPSHSDTLVLRSSVEDYRSFRAGQGSWLIQELCRVLEAKHHRLDLHQMVTIASRLVAQERVSSHWSLLLHNKKQQPEMFSTLNKTLRF